MSGNQVGILATIQQGLLNLLTGVSHQPVKKVIIRDPQKGFMKTFLGGSIMMQADTTIEVEMNEHAQSLVLKGENEAARIEAEGNAQAAVAAAEKTGKYQRE